MAKLRMRAVRLRRGQQPTRPLPLRSGTAATMIAGRIQFRHSAGTYLYCAVVPPVPHTQVTRPAKYDGVKTILPAAPTDVFEPRTVIMPPSVTEPPVILPLKGVNVRPKPELASVMSELAFAAIARLKALAAATNSDTLARIASSWYAGAAMATKIAMIATTTINSTMEKPRR